MGDAGFDQRDQLVAVTGEAAADKAGAHGNGSGHRVDALHLVDFAFLGLAAGISRSGKLPLGQAVHAVVLDQVQHVQIAADGMPELAKTNGQRIAVARHANADQVAVAGMGAGGH